MKLMWGIFVGIGLGILQLYLLRNITGMIGGPGKHSVLIVMPLILLKLIFIMFILYLMATVSIAHLLFTAGAMLVTILLVSVIYFLKKSRITKT